MLVNRPDQSTAHDPSPDSSRVPSRHASNPPAVTKSVVTKSAVTKPAVTNPGEIRPARPGDEPHIARFIRDLARYEKLEHQLDLSEARLTEHLFGKSPVCSALLVEHDGRPVGFALFFTSYSTFWCKPCLFLEDLYVDPGFRGHGYGLALLKALAAEAIARDYPRLDWHVLDWNQLAIDFYERQGATVMPDWRTCRFEGDALQRMAGH